MKKLVKELKAKHLKPARIMAIDSSSRSIAIALYEREKNKSYLINVAKFEFDKSEDMRDKLEKINYVIPEYLRLYGPIDAIVIEQTIYIQNPETSRILSYIVGHIWGTCLLHCSNVHDVTIMKWKAHIGYKNVTKKDIAKWAEELGETEAKKKAAYERKNRTINIVHSKIEGIDDVTDNDICDAIAIGLWALDNVE